MNDLLLSLFLKKMWANPSHRSLQKSAHEQKRATSVIHSWYERIALKKMRDLLKTTFFLFFFTVFPPFYAKKVNRSCRFSLFFKDWQDQFALLALYKRGTVSEPFLLIFKKEQPWANLSHQSLKKSDRMIGFFPRSNFFFFLFFLSSNWSFAHSITKKRAIRL